MLNINNSEYRETRSEKDETGSKRNNEKGLGETPRKWHRQADQVN